MVHLNKNLSVIFRKLNVKFRIPEIYNLIIKALVYFQMKIQIFKVKFQILEYEDLEKLIPGDDIPKLDLFYIISKSIKITFREAFDYQN